MSGLEKQTKALKSIYAPKAQQINGLTCAAKNISLEQYIRSVKALRREGFISKARAIWVLMVVRKAKGVPYPEFIALYRRTK